MFWEALGVGFAVSFGWMWGRTAHDTFAHWVNYGVNRFRVWRWEKANPEEAARMKAAFAGQLKAGQLGLTNTDDHGQYA